MAKNRTNPDRRGGIIVDSLGMSQMSYELTRSLNKIPSLKQYWDIIVFYRSYDKYLLPPLFGMMQEIEAWGFDGPVMSTSLITTKTLLNALRPRKKYFYVWNLEWKIDSYDIEELHSIYCNPDIELIARNKYHFDLIKETWKEPAGIIEDFNHEQIIRLFET